MQNNTNINNPYYYIGQNPTVDLLIINPQKQILLIKRSENTNACPNQWAFPGGFIDTTAQKNEVWKNDREKPQDAAIRELKEETNLTIPDNTELNFIGVYEGNNRDPRDNPISWSKSYAYMYEISEELFNKQKNLIKGLDDAQDVAWVNLENVKNMELAFDHNIIFEDMKDKFIHKQKIKKFK